MVLVQASESQYPSRLSCSQRSAVTRSCRLPRAAFGSQVLQLVLSDRAVRPVSSSDDCWFGAPGISEQNYSRLRRGLTRISGNPLKFRAILCQQARAAFQSFRIGRPNHRRQSESSESQNLDAQRCAGQLLSRQFLPFLTSRNCQKREA
jgi:hypothetical protein